MEKRSRRYLSESLSQIVDDALRNRVFSACSIAYLWCENNKIYYDNENFGETDENGKGTQVKEGTFYDLASLTKPLVTALVFMTLVDGKKVYLDDTLATIFPELRGEISKISIRMLLGHSSGLPAHRQYYRTIVGYSQEERKQAVLRMICDENLIFQPGHGILYSDLGFILLGFIVEKLTGESLADFWTVRIARPLGLDQILLFPGSGGLPDDVCVSTKSIWSKERLCGTVHDDNCRMLGGVAGHAGLFGSATGVLTLIGHLLQQYREERRHPAFSNNVLRDFLSRNPGSAWSCGFDSPTPGSSSSGSFFSHQTVGHLGYTGTSFWLDLEANAAIVLLTNRVLMGDDPAPIRHFRPVVHDVIMKDILERNQPD